MGCFWGAESAFGVAKGVIRTKVGYTGGSSKNPTYRSMGDHTETVELQYDPNEITYRVSPGLHVSRVPRLSCCFGSFFLQTDTRQVAGGR